MSDIARTIIAVGGENLIDWVDRDGAVTTRPGGSPFNVALALGRQETTTHYLSPISSDKWGNILAQTLIDADVHLAGGRVDLPTSMARVSVTNGIPSYRFERENTAERAITLSNIRSLLEGVTALHTGSMALCQGNDAEVWESATQIAHEHDKVVSIDPNVRLSVITDMAQYRARLSRILSYGHLIKLSDEDLDALFPDLDEDEALTHLCGHYPTRLIVLTRGADGASAWSHARQRIDVDAPPVRALQDTVGAGDTFMATLLATLGEQGQLSAAGLETLKPSQIADLLKRACLAAALNCEKEGCDPPRRDTLMSALAATG